MYLIICENKDGLSIEDAVPLHYGKAGADTVCEFKNIDAKHGNKYHVRKFDLGSIDLARLMVMGER